MTAALAYFVAAAFFAAATLLAARTDAPRFVSICLCAATVTCSFAVVLLVLGGS